MPPSRRREPSPLSARVQAQAAVSVSFSASLNASLAVNGAARRSTTSPSPPSTRAAQVEAGLVANAVVQVVTAAGAPQATISRRHVAGAQFVADVAAADQPPGPDRGARELRRRPRRRHLGTGATGGGLLGGPADRDAATCRGARRRGRRGRQPRGQPRRRPQREAQRHGRRQRVPRRQRLGLRRPAGPRRQRRPRPPR